MLTCHNISFARGERKLFENLGFTLSAGGILMIKGANGVGKTTLLRIIAMLCEMQEGELLWQKEKIEERDREIYWKNIAYAGHKNALIMNFTVFEYLKFWASLRKTELMLPAVVEIFQLHDVMECKCANLSCGWQKRVGLSKIMFFDAILWILDEPFANLDENAKKIVTNVFQSRADQDGIVIFSSNESEIPKLRKFNVLNIEDSVSNSV